MQTDFRSVKARLHYALETDSSPIQNVFMRPHINPLSRLVNEVDLLTKSTPAKSPEEVAWQANETTPVYYYPVYYSLQCDCRRFSKYFTWHGSN